MDVIRTLQGRLWTSCHKRTKETETHGDTSDLKVVGLVHRVSLDGVTEQESKKIFTRNKRVRDNSFLM